ncbi:MAG TPA: amidase [Gemmatimonadales bacterium]|nr:amidase [Gemmatimonadales bacterium]
MPDIAFLTIPELGRLLRMRRVSAVEMAGEFLGRLERLGSRYNAVVRVLRESALAEAGERDAELARGKDRGPLHGIPYGVKDLISVAGAPTVTGPSGYRNQLHQGDATLVRRLRRAGAVLCAKLAMVELAGGMGYRQAFATCLGPGRSPWDPSRWSGGSSSGPGAAVAAGLVPFAIGSETWGSIQYPAAFCGITGLRPTYGRVSRHGSMTLSATMDKLGPMARTAEDCALVLGAMAGSDPEDPTALARRFTPPSGPGTRRYRIGVLRGTLECTQPEVRRNFLTSLELLGGFADVRDDLELPDFPYDAMAGLVLDAEAADAFEPLFQSGPITRLTAPEDRVGGYPGQVVLAGDYLRAIRLRRPAAAALDRLLATVDAIAAPSLPTVAWPVETPLEQVYPEYPGGTSIAGAANLCGVPALFLMNGQGEAGLPTSLQLTGRAQAEATLLEIGMQVQQRTNFHRQHPPGL